MPPSDQTGDSSSVTPAVERPVSRRVAAISQRARDQLVQLRLWVAGADILVVQGALLFWTAWNLGRAPLPFESWVLLVAVPFQILMFAWRGAFACTLAWTLRTWIRTGLDGLLWFALVLMALLYATGQGANTPRLAVLGWLISAGFGVVAVRLAGWRWLRARRGGMERTVVLVGDLHRCVMVEAQLVSAGAGSGRPVAMVLPEGQNLSTELVQSLTVPLIHLRDLGSFAIREQVDRILVCAAIGDDVLLENVLTELLPYPVEVSLVPDLTRLPLFCMRIEQEGRTPIINLSASPMQTQDLVVKRIEDLVLSILILVVMALPMLVIALLVKCSSPGPVLFVQKRHGLMGKTIRVFKFRTMTAKPESPEENSGTTEPTTGDFLNPKTEMHFRQAVRKDTRVTPIGAVLRRFSLDELPQFFNVVAGDMSIVGPRPHARIHNLEYLAEVPYLMRRHYVKPGITGLAQIQGSRGRTEGAESMRRRVALDLEYIRRWSLWLDVRIIASTMLWGFYTDEP